MKISKCQLAKTDCNERSTTTFINRLKRLTDVTDLARIRGLTALTHVNSLLLTTSLHTDRQTDSISALWRQRVKLAPTQYRMKPKLFHTASQKLGHQLCHDLVEYWQFSKFTHSLENCPKFPDWLRHFYALLKIKELFTNNWLIHLTLKSTLVYLHILNIPLFSFAVV